MPTLTPYLVDTNLPLKPLAAHLNYATNTLATTLHQNGSDADWQGRSVRFLSKMTLAAGAVGCCTLASVESISGIFIGGMGLLCSFLFFGGRLETLEKWSFQLVSYGTHSLLATTLSLYLALSCANLEYHTWNTLADRAMHVISSAAIQGYGATILDAIFGREEEPSYKRITNLMKNIPLEWLSEVKSAADRDLHYAHGQPILQMHPGDLSILQIEHMGNTLELNIELPLLLAYLRKQALDIPFLTAIDLFKLNTDSTYRSQVYAAAERFIVFPEDLDRVDNRPIYSANYIKHIETIIETALLNIIISDPLCHLLANDIPATVLRGLENIQSATTWINCLSFAQYKELCEPIQCSDLGRRKALLKQKTELARLSDAEKKLLEQYILKGQESLPKDLPKNLIDKLCKLNSGIGMLASELHQGSFKTAAVKIWTDCKSVLEGRIRQFIPQPAAPVVASAAASAPAYNRLLRRAKAFFPLQ